MDSSFDRGARVRQDRERVEIRGAWIDVAGGRRPFLGGMTLCPRLRPHLVAVLLHDDAALPGLVHLRQMRCVHTDGARRDLVRPSASRGCGRTPEAGDEVVLCLADGAHVRMSGIDRVQFQAHVNDRWARTARRLVGGFF